MHAATPFSIARALIPIWMAAGSGLAFGASYFSHDLSGNLLRAQTVAPGPETQTVPIRRLLTQPGATVWLNATVRQPIAPAAIQWTFNGALLTGASGLTYGLSNMAPAQVGRYEAVSTTASGPFTNAIFSVELDTDHDGLGDSWEVTYFGGITNQAGWRDADSDGVSNADEFNEGTQPNAVGSLNPRLEIYAENGTVTADPLLPFYTNGQKVTLTAVPDPGQQFLAWFTQISRSDSPAYGKVLYARTNPVEITMIANLRAVAIMGLPVEDALDNPAAWSMRPPHPYASYGGDGWFGQTAVSHDGRSALQTSRQFLGSFLTITNPMPRDGTISFWWRSDTTPSDQCSFQVGSRRWFFATGVTNWHKLTAFAPAGVNLLKWEFNDLASDYEMPIVTAPQGAVWLDELVFEPYDDPLVDRDADGLADLWEYRYYESMSGVATNDTDLDGVSSLDEQGDGTDPTRSTSVFPRLTVLSSFGTVVKEPDLPKYEYAQTVNLQAIPDPGNYFVVWSKPLASSNATTSIRLLKSLTLTALFGLPLEQVLDAPALTFVRGGQVGFYGQLDVARDQSGSAQSGPIDQNKESWMESTLTGPGSLRFWWKSSLTRNGSWAKLLVDGIEQTKLTGEFDWQEEALDLAAGAHTVRWVVTNRLASVSGTNALWVDQVTWTPGPSAPYFLAWESSPNVLQGSNLVLSVRATGTPPRSYEWFHNGASLGSGTATLTIPAAQPAQSGDYTVTISNAYGQTSSPLVTVTVWPVPAPNDAFAQRILLTGSAPVAGHNVGATSEPDEPDAGQTVWWRWVASESGRFRVLATARSPQYGSLHAAVFQGSTLLNLTQLAEDWAYSQDIGDLYEVTGEMGFSALAGVEYAIGVEVSPPGFFQLSISRLTGPTNDNFGNRLQLTGDPVIVIGTTTNASVEVGEPQIFFQQPTASVWYSWTAPAAGDAEAIVTGDEFPMLAIYTGQALSSLTRVADGMIDYSSEPPGSRAEFTTTAGQTYQIQVAQISGWEEGLFTLSLELHRPMISAVRVTSGNGVPQSLSFDISAEPGQIVKVEASINLRDWTVIRTEVVPASGIISFSESIQQAYPQRMYRLRIEP